MEYKRLGNSGLLVSRFCLGGMTFGTSAIGSVDSSTAERLVDMSLDAGINFVDTANMYKKGVSEEMLGKALEGKRNKVVLATKVRAPMGEGPNEAGLSRKHVMDEVENSLRRLGTDYIDLYLLHWWDEMTPLEETLETMSDLVRAGKIRYIGASNFFAWQIVKALGLSSQHGWPSLKAIQMHYSLLCRDIEEEIIPMIRSEKVGLTVWSPLSGGYLSGKYQNTPDVRAPQGTRFGDRGDWFPYFNRELGDEVTKTLQTMAADYRATPAQLALAWLLHKSDVTSVLIGARKPEQLQENLKAEQILLHDADLAWLDEQTKPPQRYPGWMANRVTFSRSL